MTKQDILTAKQEALRAALQIASRQITAQQSGLSALQGPNSDQVLTDAKKIFVWLVDEEGSKS